MFKNITKNTDTYLVLIYCDTYTIDVSITLFIDYHNIYHLLKSSK